MRRTLSGFRAAALLASMSPLLVACGERQVTVASPPFEAVFELSEVIELGEDPADSIAEVGVFVERRDGGLIIGDRLLPRVRTYAEDGSLEAGFGRFGEGPWELQRISGVAETASGRIVVASPYTRWLTYLNSDLSPDTVDELDYANLSHAVLGQFRGCRWRGGRRLDLRHGSTALSCHDSERSGGFGGDDWYATTLFPEGASH